MPLLIFMHSTSSTTWWYPREGSPSLRRREGGNDGRDLQEQDWEDRRIGKKAGSSVVADHGEGSRPR